MIGQRLVVVGEGVFELVELFVRAANAAKGTERGLVRKREGEKGVKNGQNGRKISGNEQKGPKKDQKMSKKGPKKEQF